MTEALFPSNKKAQEKLQSAINLLKKNYYASSEISKLVEVEDATDDTDLQMLGFRHLIPKEWFTREDVIIDIAFQQFGANLASSETHFIVDSIFNESLIKRRITSTNVREEVLSEIESFSHANVIDAMLAPIDLYVDMHVKWLQESPDKIKMDFRTGDLSFCNVKPAILYSNKFMPFNDFALINKGFGKWISSPNIENRLTVKISQGTDDNNLDLLFYDQMKFKIVDPEKVLILQKPEKGYTLVI